MVIASTTRGGRSYRQSSGQVQTDSLSSQVPSPQGTQTNPRGWRQEHSKRQVRSSHSGPDSGQQACAATSPGQHASQGGTR